jgi:glucose/arabinose dehydrogenase
MMITEMTRPIGKEILFQGIGGEQHDHGMHTFNFGPDGKLYFNFGNEGKTLRDKNNKVVLDQDGDEIGPNKYQQGWCFVVTPTDQEWNVWPITSVIITR